VRTSLYVVTASCALILLLTGCSGSSSVSTSTQSNAVRGTALQGRVHGGQQPIIGASVYLFAANTAGSGNASISLLSSASGTSRDSIGNYYVTTDSSGTFSISGDYTCPSTTSQLYLYAVGGNPGAGTNSAAGLMAALGTCPANGTLPPSLYILMNEVSTIATAYAISGYASDATHVSSSGLALAQTGLANAFAAVPNLETLSTGAALATTPAGNGIVPQAEINTLANILASCINSAEPGSAACTTLFSNARNGNTAPSDTATAAINIAHHPSANIASLYSLQQGTGAPFLPNLGAAPNDFTIAIGYTVAGLVSPGAGGLAIDASGNVWIAGQTNSTLLELSPVGVVLSGSSGFTGGGLDHPYFIAIDASKNVWVTNFTGSSLSKFSSNGTPLSGASGYTDGGISSPQGIAVDASGHVWTTNRGNESLSEFDSSGTAISGSSGFTGGGLSRPEGIAFDVSGNAWVTNETGSSISEFDSSGAAISGSPFTGGGLSQPQGIAIDNLGNVWVANYGGKTSEFTSTGTALSSNGYAPGGAMIQPAIIAIDGSGNAWVTTYEGHNVIEFNSSGIALSGATGYSGAGIGFIPGVGFGDPYGIAIDGSGNVWVGNVYSDYITELIGAATPVVTPVVANLMSPYGIHAVNRP